MENNNQTPSDKLFHPGLFRANGRIWIADLSDGAASRPKYLIDYQKLIDTLSHMLSLEKKSSKLQDELFDTLNGFMYGNKDVPPVPDIPVLIEEFIANINDFGELKDILRSCVCRDEALIDKYMDYIAIIANEPKGRLFRFDRRTLVESLDTTMTVSGLNDIKWIVENAMPEAAPQNIRILNAPIHDPRLPLEWSGVNYHVVADIEGQKAQCVGMSNFYDE